MKDEDKIEELRHAHNFLVAKVNRLTEQLTFTRHAYIYQIEYIRTLHAHLSQMTEAAHNHDQLRQQAEALALSTPMTIFEAMDKLTKEAQQ